MSHAAVLVAGLLAGAAVALLIVRRLRRRDPPARRRILFPYVGTQLSVPALDAALRLARVEHATLVPAYLLEVPRALSLDAPIPRDCARAFDLQEAIEQRATRAGIPVDARIGPGRTVRHSLRGLLEDERYDRLVVPAATAHTDGLDAGDVAWLLEHAPGEVVVLRGPQADR